MAKKPPKRGVITSFDGSQGVLRLDDGSELVFFRYSFGAITPVVGMAVEVRKTEPFHKGGLRATDLSVVGQRLDRNAKLDRSWAVDHLRVEQERQREARETERRQAEEAVERFNTRWLKQHPAPEQPTLEQLLGAPLPEAVTQLLSRAGRDVKPQLNAPADPAFVPLVRVFGRWLGVTVHPELPLELGLADDLSVCDRTAPTARLESVLALIDDALADDDERPNQEALTRARALFRASKPSRADSALVSSWLDAVHGGLPSRNERSAVLLDLYQERGWSQLETRLRGMVEHLNHADEWRAAEVDFLRRERGKKLSERAADELLGETSDD